jgi:hypothetical protein
MTPLPWLTTEGSALLTLLVTAGFLCLSLAIGRRLLRMCGALTEGTRAERAVICVCLGAGALQFVPFALGVAGAFNVMALRIAAGLVLLLALPDLRAIASSVMQTANTSPRRDNWVVAWVLALSPAALIAALIALAPSLDPDGLAYHLTVPKRWLSLGRLDYLPTYPFSAAPMGMELLFAWAMALAGDSAAKCIHLVMGLSAAAAIYLAGKRLCGRMTGVVPTTLFLVGPGGLAAILGFSYVEGGAALATASAALAWLIWYQSSIRGFLRVAALLAGFAVTFKLSAALFPVGLGALSVLAVYDRLRTNAVQRPLAGTFLAMMALIPLVAAPVLPWVIRAFALTGNPFFPMLANRIPTRDLSADLATKVDNYNRYMTWGNVVGREWTLEQRSHILLAVALGILLVGVFAAFKLRTRMGRGTAIIVTLTAIAQLGAAGLYLRYWLPLAAALMLPVVAPLERQLARRPVLLAWIAITLACSLVQARHSFQDERGSISGLLATLAGVQDRTTFLEERLGAYPLYERINRDLPANAGIMLSGYCGGFYIDRATFCAEMVQTSLRFTSWEEFAADVRRLGITHLVAPSALATGGPTPYLGGSAVSVITRAGQYRVVRQLLTQHARTLQTAVDLGLYEIDPAWLESRADASVAP